jgi:hypothetical protein
LKVGILPVLAKTPWKNANFVRPVLAFTMTAFIMTGA